jgi:hypothetical protein
MTSVKEACPLKILQTFANSQVDYALGKNSMSGATKHSFFPYFDKFLIWN